MEREVSTCESRECECTLIPGGSVEWDAARSKAMEVCSTRNTASADNGGRHLRRGDCHGLEVMDSYKCPGDSWGDQAPVNSGHSHS